MSCLLIVIQKSTLVSLSISKVGSIHRGLNQVGSIPHGLSPPGLNPPGLNPPGLSPPVTVVRRVKANQINRSIHRASPKNNKVIFAVKMNTFRFLPHLLFSFVATMCTWRKIWRLPKRRRKWRIYLYAGRTERCGIDSFFLFAGIEKRPFP